jgi:porin
MKKTFYAALAIFTFVSANILAQDKEKGPDYLSFGASYTGDFINNLSGGIKTGSAYLGMANITAEFDFEKAKLWKGGKLFIFGANTHGATPTADLVGDLQGISNIEAGNHTYLQELWYKQQLGKFEFTAGLQDLAVEFGNVEYGGLYLNSSFGVKSSISHNIPAPIFPLTNMGFTAKWDISDKFTWLAAAYDGTPTDFDENPYNIKWEFEKGDGYLAISEVQYKTKLKGLDGTYKLGGLYNSREEDGEDVNIASIYANGNQKLWEQDNRSFGAFAQLGYSPSDASICDYYIGAGVNYTGLFNKKGNDEIGLAFAHEHYKNSFSDPETAIELTYKYQLMENIYIQPDIQHIINPTKTGEKLNNAFTANIRLGISF